MISAIELLNNVAHDENKNAAGPGQLVLVRHGQSDWNQKNLFTGWTDVDLTEGREEAQQAGRTLAERITFDIAFTSCSTRAIRTLWLDPRRDAADVDPVENHWRLNERHYGALQGLDKAQPPRSTAPSR